MSEISTWTKKEDMEGRRQGQRERRKEGGGTRMHIDRKGNEQVLATFFCFGSWDVKTKDLVDEMIE